MLETILAFQESPCASASQPSTQSSHSSARTHPTLSLIDELPLAALALSAASPLPSPPASSAYPAHPPPSALGAAGSLPWPAQPLYPTVGHAQFLYPDPSGLLSGASALRLSNGVTPAMPTLAGSGGKPWGEPYPQNPVGMRPPGPTPADSQGVLWGGWAPAQGSNASMSAPHSTVRTVPAGNSGGSAGGLPGWGPPFAGLSPNCPAGPAWGACPASNPTPQGSLPPVPHSVTLGVPPGPTGGSPAVFHSLPQGSSSSQTLPSETPAARPGFHSGAQPSTAPTHSVLSPRPSGRGGSHELVRLPLHLAQMGRSPGQAEDMECPLGAGLRFGAWPDAAVVSPLLASAALGRSASLPARQVIPVPSLRWAGSAWALALTLQTLCWPFSAGSLFPYPSPLCLGAASWHLQMCRTALFFEQCAETDHVPIVHLG